MTVDLERLCDEWDDCREKNPELSIEQFLEKFADDVEPGIVAEFRQHVSRLDAADQRISPLLDNASTDPDVISTSDTRESSALIDLRPGEEPISGYRLLKKLGKGGFGEVWKATGPGDFPVALKFVRLDERAGQIEERSLDLLKHLRHPHLLSIFGAWRQSAHLIIASELADHTLSDRLKERQAAGEAGIPRDELLRYLAEAAEALDFLNNPPDKTRPRIQHRDIKPENIFLSGGAVKVGDLGLLRAMKGSQTGHTGSMTLAYAPPEFIEGRTSDRSDQYSLAVTYCLLRGGRLPFTGHHAEMINGHMHRRPDLSMLPVEERPSVARALAKKPRKRWESCGAFVEALRTSVAPGLDVSTDDRSAGRTLSSSSQWNLPSIVGSGIGSLARAAWRWPRWTAALLGLIVVFGVIAFQWNDDPKLRALTARIESNPQDPKAYQERAEHYLDQGDWKPAIADATEALGLEPGNSEYLMIRGKGYLRGNRPKIAIQDFNQVLGTEPQNADALARRAEAYTTLQDFTAALTDLNEAHRLEPENHEYLTLRGHVYRMTERWDEAMDDFNEAIRIQLGDPGARAGRAWVLAMQRRWGQAMQEANEVVQDHPDFATGQRVLGTIYSMQGQFDEALAAMSEAIRLDPENPMLYTTRGVVKTDAGDSQSALDDFYRALELEPDHFGTLWCRARAYYELGDFQNAMDDLTKAIDMKSDDPDFFELRAACALQLGDLQTAIDDATTSIKQNSKQADAYGTRAIAHIRSGELDKAIEDATTAIKLRPTEPRYVHARAFAYRESGEDAKADADERRLEYLMGEQDRVVD